MNRYFNTEKECKAFLKELKEFVDVKKIRKQYKKAADAKPTSTVTAQINTGKALNTMSAAEDKYTRNSDQWRNAATWYMVCLDSVKYNLDIFAAVKELGIKELREDLGFKH